MHYFKRNIGDYAKKAGRLSMLQHGAYTLLLDACYDREQFPTLEEAIEWTWASTTEEEEAVRFVLRKFFVLEDGVYVQKRIQEEINEYHSKSEINKRIAIERETKRKEKSTNRAQDVHEPPPNQEPITNNHIKPSRASPPSDARFARFWSAYPKKVAKGAAEKEWKKIKPDDALLDQMLEAIQLAMTSHQWIEKGGQYIPRPSKWLNEKCWEDEFGTMPERKDWWNE